MPSTSAAHKRKLHLEAHDGSVGPSLPSLVRLPQDTITCIAQQLIATDAQSAVTLSRTCHMLHAIARHELVTSGGFLLPNAFNRKRVDKLTMDTMLHYVRSWSKLYLNGSSAHWGCATGPIESSVIEMRDGDSLASLRTVVRRLMCSPLNAVPIDHQYHHTTPQIWRRGVVDAAVLDEMEARDARKRGENSAAARKRAASSKAAREADAAHVIVLKKV